MGYRFLFTGACVAAMTATCYGATQYGFVSPRLRSECLYGFLAAAATDLVVAFVGMLGDMRRVNDHLIMSGRCEEYRRDTIVANARYADLQDRHNDLKAHQDELRRRIP